MAGRDQAKVSERAAWQQAIDEMYALVADEIRNRAGQPLKPVSFGTSGWRGLLGKELFVRSVAVVTAAILSLYKKAEQDGELADALGMAFDTRMLARKTPQPGRDEGRGFDRHCAARSPGRAGPPVARHGGSGYDNAGVLRRSRCFSALRDSPEAGEIDKYIELASK